MARTVPSGSRTSTGRVAITLPSVVAATPPAVLTGPPVL